MNIHFHLDKIVQEMIQVGLLITSASTGRILYTNTKLHDMFGYSREMLSTMTFSDLLCEGEDQDLWKRETDYNVVKFKTSDASVIWGLISSQEILDAKQHDRIHFYSISDITRRKHAEDRLKNSELRLRHLSKKLIDAQEEERKRISMELHDGIGSNITAVRLMLERKIAESGHTDHELDNIVDMLRRISSDTRQISRNLHPSVLEEIGVDAAFTAMIREFNELNPGLILNPRISIDEDKIPPKAKLTIYRTAQESLNNIIKHSHADRVDITCVLSDGFLQLTIIDNGCGFDVDETLDNEKTGLGLVSMKERARICNGSLSIESEIGIGTRVYATIPSC